MLVSHSGSRGTGAKVGDHYIKLAKDVCPGKAPDGYHWIPADTDAGREYWMVMNLMGRYAQACHHLIHARFALAAGDAIERSPFFYSIGIESGFPTLLGTAHAITATVDGRTKAMQVSLLENHHNFAWEEEWPEVGKVYIHRKGATPAAAGQWGIIPGSSGSYSYVVEGKYGNLGHGYETENLNSASHGAGRPRSRSASKAIHDASAYATATSTFGVTHDGVAPDETVFAYKDIESVMVAQQDIVYRRATLKPIFVKMGGLKGDDGD